MHVRASAILNARQGIKDTLMYVVAKQYTGCLLNKWQKFKELFTGLL